MTGAGRLTAAAADLTDPALVGHKFARQEALRATGFPVPRFECVPAAAFDHVLAQARPALPAAPLTAGASMTEITAWSQLARAAVIEVGVPEALAGALLDCFDRLDGGQSVVAVRSCAVSDDGRGGGEDSAADPFAGLGDSFLAVSRAELLAKVSLCWASAFNPEGVLYRLRRGVDPMSPRMAVGIQRMVPSARSFVAFSRDPRGGPRTVIAAAYGLGEGVVQEKADIDHFFVDGATGAVERRLTTKHRYVIADAASGTMTATLPADLAEPPVLDDDDARRVTALALAVENHYGCAQDIEGAFTVDGELHLVQARPVVSAPVTRTGPASPPVGADLVHWSNGNISESYAGVTSPLTFSVAGELYAVGFEDFYLQMGVSPTVLRRDRFELRRMLGYVDGRIFLRLDTFYHLHSNTAVFAVLRRSWERGIATGDAKADFTPRWGRVRAVADVPASVLRLIRLPWQVRAFYRWWDAYLPTLADIGQRSPGELVRTYRELWSQVAVRWGRLLVNNTYLLREISLAENLMRRWAPGADRSMLNGMLCGGPVNRSILAVRALLQLAELLTAVPAAREAVLHGDDRETWRSLAAGEFGAEAAVAALAYVNRYGDRGLHDLKLEVLTVRQEPSLLIGMLWPVVSRARTVAASQEQERQVRAQAESDLGTHTRGPLRRMILRGLFRAMRWHMRIRENHRFSLTELIGVSRQILSALGRHLVEAKQLDDARDIFDLTVEELLGGYEGTLPDDDLRTVVAGRRQARQRWSEQPDPPDRFGTDTDLPVALTVPAAAELQPLDPAMVLSGLASSGGRVRGQARVITDPNVSAESCEGRILIARETDPGWLFLMLGAKGLVAERGTVLSHMAITGRIFGIPTVVAVDGVLGRIPDGAWVELDGDRGTIRLLSAEEADEACTAQANAAADAAEAMEGAR